MPSSPPLVAAGEERHLQGLPGFDTLRRSLDALDIPPRWLMLLLCLLSGLPVSSYGAVLSISHPWLAHYIQVLAAALLCLSLRSPESSRLPPQLSGLPGLWRDFSSWVLCSPGPSQMLNFPTESLRQVQQFRLSWRVGMPVHLSFPSGWSKWLGLMIWLMPTPAFTLPPSLLPSWGARTGTAACSSWRAQFAFTIRARSSKRL